MSYVGPVTINPAPKTRRVYLSRHGLTVFTPRIGTRKFDIHIGRWGVRIDQTRWTKDGYPAFFKDGTY